MMRAIYEPLRSAANIKKRADAIPRPDCARVPARSSHSAKSAELIKHGIESFLAMKISFINAVAISARALARTCSRCGKVSARIRASVGVFLNPGIGYGGSCFPKDLKAFSTPSLREFGSTSACSTR